MSPPQTDPIADRIEEITREAAARVRQSPTRSEVYDLKVQIALLVQRIDHLIEDRDRAYRESAAKLNAIDSRLRDLELQGATIKTWGVVAGAVWSLVLTLIGLKIWSPG